MKTGTGADSTDAESLQKLAEDHEIHCFDFGSSTKGKD